MKTILLILMLAFTPAFVGCKATPQQIAFNTTEGVVTSVDLAMKGWADYVVTQRDKIAATPPLERGSMEADLLRREGKVMNALSEYQSALRTARPVVNASLATNGPMPSVVAGAASSVLNAIQEARN